MMRYRSGLVGFSGVVATVLALIGVGPGPSGAEVRSTATPAEMVASFDALADAVLAVRRTEESLVRSILGATYAHARVELRRARASIGSGDQQAARRALENLAAVVGHLGTEGDRAVAAVRKRLVEGGHHHNAKGEAAGIYDEGYVIVTRAAKKVFLDASRAIGQLAPAPESGALEAEWSRVESTWSELMQAAG
ncbi:MAG: hypothetical protein ACE5JH_12560 [Acidobacteriota bacterium]